MSLQLVQLDAGQISRIINGYLSSYTSFSEKAADKCEKIISEIFDECITSQELPKCGMCTQSMRRPVRLACGHAFHSSCFKRWLGIRESCPCDLTTIDILSDPHKNATRVQHSPLIKFIRDDKETNVRVYKMHPLHLSSAKRYMFYPIEPNEEHLIACAMKFFTFHPFNQCAKNKFKINLLKIDGIDLYVCSFPKEFENTCEKAAAQFGLAMKNINRVIVGGRACSGLNTALECPASDKILMFKGERLDDASYFIKKQKEIIETGNCLAALGLD